MDKNKAYRGSEIISLVREYQSAIYEVEQVSKKGRNGINIAINVYQMKPTTFIHALDNVASNIMNDALDRVIEHYKSKINILYDELKLL